VHRKGAPAYADPARRRSPQQHRRPWVNYGLRATMALVFVEALLYILVTLVLMRLLS